MTLEEVQKLIPVREGEDFDRNKVQRYLQNQLNLRDAPLEVFQFSTGFSNLTYMLRMGIGTEY